MFIICKPSGTRFRLDAPTPAMVHVRDIARHLSMKCRWSGGVEHFYSVAQHSVMVSRWIEPAHAFLGLMHDAEEAYTGDVSSPMKAMFADAHHVASVFTEVIGARFGITPKHLWPASLKHYDNVALVTEWRDIVVPPEGVENWGMPNVEPWPETLVGVSPAEAEGMFLARFAELYQGE
ncbi:MAG TPA: hypothetical protein VLE97_01720 [Gaiellaceae bacterium]|nr:hypothetical protein [Gaiellaceae bacterium]